MRGSTLSNEMLLINIIKGGQHYQENSLKRGSTISHTLLIMMMMIYRSTLSRLSVVAYLIMMMAQKGVANVNQREL